MSGPVASPGLTDVHAHPAMNAWLWGRDLRRHWFSGDTFNPLASLSDFTMLKKGGVKVVWSSLHVPERQYMECRSLRLIARAFPGGRELLAKDGWACLVSMRDEMERQVARAEGMRIVRSNGELDDAVAGGDVAFVHTVEGGHHLGAGLPDHDLDGRLRRIDELAGWGVASLTLAHLFPVDLAGHAEGIPEAQRTGVFRRLCPLETGVDLDRGLTATGRAVLDRMIERRIIPDVTHCSPRARREIYAHAGDRIPIVATHVGVRALNPQSMNLDDEDVRAIAASGGLVGVIFMPYWLDERNPKAGLGAIWQTMQELHRAGGGTWDHIAIGTDFDGFTDPPDDCNDASQLPKVRERLEAEGAGRAAAEAILGGNARRVLRDGWV